MDTMDFTRAVQQHEEAFSTNTNQTVYLIEAIVYFEASIHYFVILNLERISATTFFQFLNCLLLFFLKLTIAVCLLKLYY